MKKYNAGIHKGRNLSRCLAGWGIWVALFRPVDVHALFDPLVPLGSAALYVGVFYLVLGVMSERLIVGERPRLGLSLMTGGFLSLTLYSAAYQWTQIGSSGSVLGAASPTIYVYASLAYIGFTAVDDYAHGVPYG